MGRMDAEELLAMLEVIHDYQDLEGLIFEAATHWME
jgi:hypothetical protein